MSTKKKTKQIPVSSTTETTIAAAPVGPVKIDLGCGKNKIGPDWTGVDSKPFPGVDVVMDLTKAWPWKDNSVDEVHCSHFLEHLDAEERIYFVNELYRVMKPGAVAKIITPHPFSERAYGDLTHKWPPVASFWFYYLDPKWREVNAPHNDFYKCDFEIIAVYTMRQDLIPRNAEFQQLALMNFKEAAQDTIATFKKR